MFFFFLQNGSKDTKLDFLRKRGMNAIRDGCILHFVNIYNRHLQSQKKTLQKCWNLHSKIIKVQLSYKTWHLAHVHCVHVCPGFSGWFSYRRIEDFTVSWPSQIFPTNENSTGKSGMSLFSWGIPEFCDDQQSFTILVYRNIKFHCQGHRIWF